MRQKTWVRHDFIKKVSILHIQKDLILTVDLRFVILKVQTIGLSSFVEITITILSRVVESSASKNRKPRLECEP